MILFVEEEHRDALPDKEIRFREGRGIPAAELAKVFKSVEAAIN